MGPYSLDLRWRIVAAYQNGEGSIRELGERFSVAPNTVQNYLRQLRTSGEVTPCPHGGGMPRKIDEPSEHDVCALLEEKSQWTLAELAEQMEQRRHLRVSVATMSRMLRRMGSTRKRTLRASKQDRPDVHQARTSFQG